MKRYLSGFKFTEQMIEDAVYDCLNGAGNSRTRWHRMDVAHFIADYMIRLNMSNQNRRALAAKMHEYICTHDDYRLYFKRLIKDISKDVFHEITNRNIQVEPINYLKKKDNCSGKIRDIGIASIKQQIYDHVCVMACHNIFMSKIGRYQCASIKGRGQSYGKKTIERWIRKNPKKCRWIWKGDIRKFYPSVSHRVIKKLLRRDIKNDDVLYVLFFLIDSYGDKGLCIGSYLSQFLANYYLSYAYHFLDEKCFKTRHKRNGKNTNVRLLSHHLFYMDDIIIFSPNKKYLRMCIKKLFKYLQMNLELEVKPEHQLFKLDSRPIDMMGFKFYTYKTTIRKRIFVRINRLISKYRNPNRIMTLANAKSIMCYKGYLDHSDSRKYKEKHKFERIALTARRVIRNANSSIH